MVGDGTLEVHCCRSFGLVDAAAAAAAAAAKTRG